MTPSVKLPLLSNSRFLSGVVPFNSRVVMCNGGLEFIIVTGYALRLVAVPRLIGKFSGAGKSMGDPRMGSI